MRKIAALLSTPILMWGSGASATANGHSVGLCYQIAGPGPHITKAIIVVPSGDKAWDQKTLADVIGMRVPAPFKYVPGTWLSVWINRTAAKGASDADPPHIDCAGIRKPR